MPCRPMVALKQPGKPGVAQAPLPLTASKIKQTACPARSKTPRSNARPFPNVLPRRLEPGQARFRNSATSFLGTSSSQRENTARQERIVPRSNDKSVGVVGKTCAGGQHAEHSLVQGTGCQTQLCAA